ncbi:MAG: hypothetical protein II009_05085, partial [Erysipelotrichaceae bacterium]|nr:hypothetical protein [Erysipelotrichaceae bacterium]
PRQYKCYFCTADLNNQNGFTKENGTWTCIYCGRENNLLTKRDIALQKAKEKWKKAKPYVLAAAAIGVGIVAAAVAKNSMEFDSDDNDTYNNNCDSYEDDEVKEKPKQYRVRIFDGDEYEDDEEVFDSEEAAEEYGLYLSGCNDLSAEIMHMSNPGDYDDEPDDFEWSVVEVE